MQSLDHSPYTRMIQGADTAVLMIHGATFWVTSRPIGQL